MSATSTTHVWWEFSDLQIRDARLADEPKVRACVGAAYDMYLERMGTMPAPLFADFVSLIAYRLVRVAMLGPDLVGLIVMWPRADHLHIDNIAVHPTAQGFGIGAALLADAHRSASEHDKGEVHLYANELMSENRKFYEHMGFVEYRRALESGFRRVYFRCQTQPPTTP